MAQQSPTHSTTEGFTLLEILIATVLMGIIILGVASFFKAITTGATYLKSSNPHLDVIPKLVTIISQDIRCSTQEPQVEHSLENDVLVMVTTNSLMYSGSKPVKVEYYIKENDSGEKILYRKETDEEEGKELTIPLTDKLEGFAFKFYSGNQWTDKPSDIVKITLKVGDKEYSFVARGIAVE